MSGTYYVNGSVTAGIWAKKSGVWSKVANKGVFIYQTVSSGGTKTVNWSFFDSFDLGSGVEEFGVTIESHTGTAAALTDFDGVSWTATSASGERSATPSGQSSTAVVNPD